MSYGLYIGRNRTSDGVSYLAGYGDEPSSHWLEIVPRAQHSTAEKIIVGVTQEADLPGHLVDIPQVGETARHIRVSYSYFRGMPAPLTNGGLNEHGVAVRDIWSPSRPELIALTPEDQTGPSYSDLARLVLERARTAREGVVLIGELIAEHGHSTYGGNSHLIADADEGWVVIECAGGKKLWAAERLGPDSIRASRPGYIGDIPISGNDSNFLYSPNLVSFAIERGWYDPTSNQPFNFNHIYGDGNGRWAGAEWIEGEMKTRAERPQKIGIEDIIWAIRTPRLTGDTAGYGQLVPLTRPEFNELRVLWHAPIGPIVAPLVPVFMGMRSVPEEFRQHRYLTTGESARFIDGRKQAAVSIVSQSVEATRSAAQIFKRLLYLTLQHYEIFLPEIAAAWEAHERHLVKMQESVAKAGAVLMAAGEGERALDYLTYFGTTELLRGLDIAEKLSAAVEARSRHLCVPAPGALRSVEQIW